MTEGTSMNEFAWFVIVMLAWVALAAGTMGIMFAWLLL